MKPHIYFWQGVWWLSRNGRESYRKGITMNDLPWADFSQLLKHGARFS